MKRFLLIVLLFITIAAAFSAETKTSNLNVEVPVECTSGSVLGLTKELTTAQAYSATGGSLSTLELAVQNAIASGEAYLYFYTYGSGIDTIKVVAKQMLRRLQDGSDTDYAPAIDTNQINYTISFMYNLEGEVSGTWMCGVLPETSSESGRQPAEATTAGFNSIRRKGICRMTVTTESLQGKTAGSKYKGIIEISLTTST